jgi:hypothetical protein
MAAPVASRERRNSSLVLAALARWYVWPKSGVSTASSAAWLKTVPRAMAEGLTEGRSGKGVSLWEGEKCLLSGIVLWSDVPSQVDHLPKLDLRIGSIPRISVWGHVKQPVSGGISSTKEPNSHRPSSCRPILRSRFERYRPEDSITSLTLALKPSCLVQWVGPETGRGWGWCEEGLY